MKVKGKEKTTLSGTTDNDGDHGKIDQIRELMFGGVARDFERRLKEISDRLDAEVALVGEDCHKRLSAMEGRLEPQIDRMQAQLRQESAARNGALDDIDTRFSQALRTQRDELNGILQQHQDAAVAAEARMREALAQLERQSDLVIQNIREHISSVRHQLTSEKLARDDLADLLGELSLRLRATQDTSSAD